MKLFIVFCAILAIADMMPAITKKGFKCRVECENQKELAEKHAKKINQYIPPNTVQRSEEERFGRHLLYCCLYLVEVNKYKE
ncbi:unnamed protein product [Hermetia illucens]|uniref:Uncharacterized protein n=1 Tax=Hermetia illucens TaxID=343691 RepID=A0A7R8YP46_HERIL|nr:unnamed protein product [Hermetia illucens]